MALREAIADTIEGVEKEYVRITNITSVSRRLTEAADRRLAGHGAGFVKVEYEIFLPDTFSGVLSKGSIPPVKLMASINTRIKAKGIVGVKVTQTPVIGRIRSVEVGAPI